MNNNIKLHQCVACFDNTANTIFEKCRHTVLCKFCAAHSIFLNKYSCPKCRQISENILSFDDIEIIINNKKDENDKKKEISIAQYKYKNFIDIIDFPIYYILKKHIDDLNDDIIQLDASSFSYKVFLDMLNNFHEIKSYKKKYMYFSRLKFIVNNLILEKKNVPLRKYPINSLVKINNKIKGFSNGFIGDVLKKIHLEQEKKKKEINDKRNDLSASIFQMEEYLEELNDTVKNKLKSKYLQTPAEAVIDENLDIENENNTKNLVTIRTVSNLICNSRNRESETDTKNATIDILEILRETMTKNFNLKGVGRTKMNNLILYSNYIISVLEESENDK